MPKIDPQAALNAVNEAIDALSLECWRGADVAHMKPVSGPDCTICIELDRIDGALGPRGQSMFAGLSENVRQCVIALYEARAALGGSHD